MMTLSRSDTDLLAPARSGKKLVCFELPGRPARKFFLYRPSTEIPGAPLVVSVHGIARNAPAHAYRLMDEAERYGLVVAAPLFGKAEYGQYQQLEDAKSGARSDEALFDILEAAARVSRADTSRILLFGYSGGAQFAHRFAMAYPDRVISAALVGAGWYTFPTDEAPYPYGVDTRFRSKLRFDAAAMASVRYHVMVGELDTLRDASLRYTKRLNAMQGHTRVERASRWVAAMTQLALQAQADAPASALMLPGVGHSFADSADKASLAQHIFKRFAADAGLKPIDLERP